MPGVFNKLRYFLFHSDLHMHRLTDKRKSRDSVFVIHSIQSHLKRKLCQINNYAEQISEEILKCLKAEIKT